MKVSIVEMDSTPFKINKELATLRTALGFTEGYDYNSEQIQFESNSVVRLNNIYDYVHITLDVVKQYYGSQYRNYLVSVALQSIPFGGTQ